MPESVESLPVVMGEINVRVPTEPQAVGSRRISCCPGRWRFKKPFKVADALRASSSFWLKRISTCATMSKTKSRYDSTTDAYEARLIAAQSFTKGDRVRHREAGYIQRNQLVCPAEIG